MLILEGMLQAVCFFLVVQAGHILFWNVRRHYEIHPWLTEAILAVILVFLFHGAGNVWLLLMGTALAIGMVRGDQEVQQSDRRSLR